MHIMDIAAAQRGESIPQCRPPPPYTVPPPAIYHLPSIYITPMPSIYISVYNLHTKPLHPPIFATPMHLCVSIHTTYTNIFACTHIHTTHARIAGATCTHRRCPRSTHYPSYPSPPLCTLRACALSAPHKRKRPSASSPSTFTPPTSHFLPRHTRHRCTMCSTLSALLPSQNLHIRHLICCR